MDSEQNSFFDDHNYKTLKRDKMLSPLSSTRAAINQNVNYKASSMPQHWWRLW